MSEPTRRTRVAVRPEHTGLRLDQFLAAATGLSRRHCRRLATDGLVFRNGVQSRVLSRTVDSGDVVDVLVSDVDPVVPTPSIPAIEILHSDDWLIAVNKPAGMLSQPAESSSEGELALDQAVLLRFALDEGRRPYLRLAHRLDRNTSGVTIFVRSKKASAAITRSWRDHLVERLYLVVVQGRLPFSATEISDPIARDPAHSWKFRAANAGRKAVTHIRTLSREAAHSVVLCRPITGRTHQVRVHLAHIGHPVVGDHLYGAEPSPNARRSLLHAWSITLPHPRDGHRCEIAAPVPRDLQDWYQMVGSSPFELWNQSLS